MPVYRGFSLYMVMRETVLIKMIRIIQIIHKMDTIILYYKKYI